MRFLIISVGLAAVAWLNFANFRRRRKMTPAERAADDEESRRELSIW